MHGATQDGAASADTRSRCCRPTATAEVLDAAPARRRDRHRPDLGRPDRRAAQRPRRAGRHHRARARRAATSACWVDNDHVAGTREMLDHLAAAGSRRIALLTSPPVSSYTFDARGAYVDWCEARGQEPVVADARRATSARAAPTRPPSSCSPPTTRPTGSTRRSTASRSARCSRPRRAASRCPTDLRIAGCTDSEPSRKARPALTALSLDPERLGREALDLLLELVEDGASATPHRLVPATVVPRASTAP